MKKTNIITILVFVGMLDVFKRLDHFIERNTETMESTTRVWIKIGSYLIFAGLILLFLYLLAFKRSDENKAILYFFLGVGLLILFMYSPLFIVWFNIPSNIFPRTLFFFPRPSPMMAQAGAFALMTSVFCLLFGKNCANCE